MEKEDVSNIFILRNSCRVMVRKGTSGDGRGSDWESMDNDHLNNMPGVILLWIEPEQNRRVPNDTAVCYSTFWDIYRDIFAL